MSAGVLRVPAWLEAVFPKVLWGHVNRVDGPIFLSFDDGPDPDKTPLVLECLERHNINAAFFLKGNRLDGRQGLIRQIREKGHPVGYHGYTHDTWWLSSAHHRLREMDPSKLPGDLPGIFSNSPLLLRAPFGRIDPLVVRSAMELDALIVQFRLVVGDWLPGKTAGTLVRDLTRKTRPGDIVVLHDGSRNGLLLPQVLDEVIPQWMDKGLRIGMFADLLKERAS